MKRAALLLLAMAFPALAVTWPDGTMTRRYVGTASGSVAGIPVVADVEAEVTATGAAFAAPSGSTFMVRGRFVRPPASVGADHLTNWSNVILVHVSNSFLRATAAWADGQGTVLATWPADWTSVTIEAVGDVTGIPAKLDPTTVMFAGQQHNTGTEPQPPSMPDDFAGITKWQGKDASQWPETVHISGVSVKGNNIYWSGGLERVGRWNEIHGNKTLNGEACLVRPEHNIAGMFDFLSREQKFKITSNLYPPESFLGVPPPQSGERVGFYIQTLQRSDHRMKERSNVVWIIWP